MTHIQGALDGGGATNGSQTVGWSGLHDGVHQSKYQTLDDSAPVAGLLGAQMLQKRGMYGAAQAFGVAVPATRAMINANEGAMSVPGSVVAGVTQRDVSVTNDAGGARGNADGGIVGSDTVIVGESAVLKNHGYVADASGNGGPALAKSVSV